MMRYVLPLQVNRFYAGLQPIGGSFNYHNCYQSAFEATPVHDCAPRSSLRIQLSNDELTAGRVIQLKGGPTAC